MLPRPFSMAETRKLNSRMRRILSTSAAARAASSVATDRLMSGAPAIIVTLSAGSAIRDRSNPSKRGTSDAFHASGRDGKTEIASKVPSDSTKPNSDTQNSVSSSATAETLIVCSSTREPQAIGSHVDSCLVPGLRKQVRDRSRWSRSKQVNLFVWLGVLF